MSEQELELPKGWVETIFQDIRILLIDKGNLNS